MVRVEITPRPGGVPADLGAPAPASSKSHAQRALVLAAAAGAPVLLRGPLAGGDVGVMAAALRGLGATIEPDPAGLRVGGGLVPGCSATLHLAENGTALRVLPVVVALLGGTLEVDGAASLRRRPLGPVLELLAQGGVVLRGTALPFGLDARRARWPARLRVAASTTTQAASGAMLGIALRARLVGEAPELDIARPRAGGYLGVTLDVLQAFGATARLEARGEDLAFAVDVPPSAPASGRYDVPADASAFAFPLALAAMHGHVWPLPASVDAAHPDRAIATDLATLRHAAPGERVVITDLGARPDTFPALCAVAAARRGETVLAGAPALRTKESDRIAAMAAALRAAGASCVERDDGLVVAGPLAAPPGRTALPTTPDHRVVMALALLGTLLPAGVTLDGAEAVDKSWPGYFTWLGRVADVRVTASSPERGDRGRS